MSAPIKIIVEGSNLSGKSSTLAALENTLLESTVMTIHGYYHSWIKDFFNTPQVMADYGLKKLFAMLPIIEASISEGVILNRFHLTDAVYLSLFHNIEQNYNELEKRLNELSVYLVLLDFNDEALERRLKTRHRESKAGPWDTDYESIKKKRDAYRSAFETSTIGRKTIFDNSHETPEETVERIVAWVQTLQ